MQNQHTRSIIIASLFWKLMERGGTQGIQFIVQIVLARLLLPEEYGIIAIVNVFILLANVFVQSGLNTALIQKKDADEVDFSSVFYVSIFIAGLLYVIIFLSAPFIAEFYHNPQLIAVLRVLSIILFFGAINSIQNAYVAKAMLFRKLFFSSLWAIVISGVFGIATAYAGWGVWALVVQQIINQLLITVILWFTVKWRPQLVFSFKKVRILFSYGWKLLASYILNTLYTDMRTLVIGRVFSASILGFYNRGKQFPQLIINNINGSIQSVMLPALSSHQDDKIKVKNLMKKSITMSSFLVFPVMMGLAVTAEPLVEIVLTIKWLPAVPFIQIYCLILAFRPIHTANAQAINALGRSDIFLRIEITRTIIGIVVLIVSIPFGVLAIAFGELISAIISTYLYSYPNYKLIKYSFIEQLVDVLPAFILTTVMGAIVYFVRYINTQTWVILIVQIVSGTVIYLGLAKLLRIKVYIQLKDILFELIGKNNKK